MDRRALLPLHRSMEDADKAEHLLVPKASGRMPSFDLERLKEDTILSFERTLGWLSPANAWNGDYIEELYQEWLQDRQAVPDNWKHFFEGFSLAQEAPMRPSGDAEEAAAQARVISFIDAYRREGHFVAKLDPLGEDRPSLPELELDFFGFGDKDLLRVFDTGSYRSADARTRMSLEELVSTLRKTYCRSVGVEYMHIQDLAMRTWLQEQMEPQLNEPRFDKSWKLFILKALTDAEVFEGFTHTRYPGQKRFSLEGGESVIPAMRYLVESSPQYGIEEVVLGMAHRGRLNVLANIMGMSYEDIFSEFEGYYNEDTSYGDGDVKYHKGFSHRYETRDGSSVHLSLTSNPSHLEAVDPVVQGRTRAKQRQHNDTEHRRKVLPFLIHGDAAFAGQGLVAETLNLSKLKGYRTGGTIHLIINNQIGFTTSPEDARSTTYATDVAKMIESPVFHVNGDDVEAVVYVMDLAIRFRQTFGCDVMIDMICYRKHGHNESDEPAFTQPLMYKKIKEHPSPRTLYVQKLIQENSISEAEEKALLQAFQEQLQKALEQVRQKKKAPKLQAYEARWVGLDHPYDDNQVDTRVPHDVLQRVTKALTSVPAGFQLNSKVARKLPEFLQSVEQKGTIDWAQGELLGFGSLLYEGTPVRLSGQDSARGTFSHRHAVWQDLETQSPYTPLNHIDPQQARFCVYNSLLSEAAVLGFDFGYALSEPHMLILWEAQFGDFVNGAQVIIDQFIVSSGSKWQRTNGIVMLLPHGYEGQGPEHSHAYLERYLLACAENNIQVCNLTTPAQYFHALRRQVRRPFRRPLIIMAPKSLLRHPMAQSPIKDLVEDHFHEILDDPEAPTTAKRLLLCSGKVYYDLLQRKQKENDPTETALIRVEQFYPFAHKQMAAIKERYPAAKDVFWVQEEPQNRGGWNFMLPYLLDFFEQLPIAFVGRDASASPATASFKRHIAEQEALVEKAFSYRLSDAEKKRRSFTTIAV